MSRLTTSAIIIVSLLAIPILQIKSAANPTSGNTINMQNSESTTPDFDPKFLWDGRKMMPFRALDIARVVPASEASFLDDSDYVLGITVNGESRAYPTRFIWWHHVVNDKIGRADSGGSVPVAVTYCSVCNTGIRYDPVINGKPIKIDFYGLYNGIVALCERETSSVLLQSTGDLVTGTLKGSKLKAQPLLDTTWGKWKKLHPDTLVMAPYGPDAKHYNPKGEPEPRGYDKFPMPMFQRSLSRTDTRLPAFDKILAVSNADQSGKSSSGAVLVRAYPIKDLQKAGGVVNDQLGNSKLAVFFDETTMSAAAVNRQIDNRILTFYSKKDHAGNNTIYDKETQTQWSIEGVGEEGPLAGKSLTRMENHLSQWYGWAASFPSTTIYGRS